MAKKRVLKKEFEDFAKKVAKLELLKEQLGVLDTKGFESEAAFIRAKLKNVDSIPEIEKELEELRMKVSERESRKAIKPLIGKISEKIAVEGESLKERIEELINRKKELSESKGLSKKDYDEGIRKINDELEELKKSFEKHTKSFSIPLDSNVDIAVDRGFGEFLSSLKVKLSRDVEAKKSQMQNKMIKNLSQQKKDFAKKYSEMARELHKKYEARVKGDLKDEVRKRFNEHLQKRLEEEKEKLRASISEEKGRELEIGKIELISRLDAEYKRKESLLDGRFKQQIERKQQELNERERLLESKFKEAEDEEKALLEEERKVLESERENLRKEYENNTELERKKLREQFDGMKRELESSYEKKIDEAEQKEREISKKLEDMSRKIRSELEKNYEKKLSEAIKIERSKIDKEKKAFEEHVIEQARKLFR